MRLALAVVSLALSGCIFSDDPEPTCGDGHVDSGEACDDGNGVSGDGCSACVVDVVPRSLRVAWSFKNLATAQVTPCPATYDTAEVVTQAVTSDGQPIGMPKVDVFDCSRGGGTVVFDAAAVAEVRTTVRISTGTGGMVYAESVPEVLDLATSDRELNVVLLNDGGYFKVAWRLRGATSGNELTCSSANEPDAIRIISTIGGSMKTDRFSCSDGAAVTGGLVAGTYSIAVTAEDSGNPLGPATTQTGKVVMDRNRITDLGVIDVAITGL